VQHRRARRLRRPAPKLTVYVGSQIPYADRAQIAAALDLPEDQVRVVGTLIGGGFGGKEDIMGQIHAALLAQATGRPVKILYDRASHCWPTPSATPPSSASRPVQNGTAR
jgi:CO/xanthine dehydrogenase Mo-binding subunit